MAIVVIAYGQREQTPIETALLEHLGYQVRYLDGIPDPPGDELADADAVLVTVQAITEQTLSAMPACKIIARVGTGLDSIDLDAAARRGIVVTYVADYSVDEVSTHAITLLMAWARRLPQYLALVRSGQWDSTGAGVIRRLRGQTLGVAGFGRIGQATAAKAAGLGLRVLAFDPYRPAAEIEAAGAFPADWPALLAGSDYVSLHIPLTPESAGLIDAAALAQMKPTAILINTARGGLVDEAALLSAIQGGRIAGAALDVLVHEPPARSAPLLGDPRILITPHTGWYSQEAQEDVAVRACEEVQRVLAGQPPRSPANVPLTVTGLEAS
jgi:D-3-phosphoglycerate dehydrogenase / 2-oxoglutarate reductase